MKKYENALKSCPLFAEIGEEELLRMLTCLEAQVVTYEKKSVIFAEGSPARYIGVLLAGAVQLIRLDYDGNRSLLGEVREGEVFADAFACAETEAMPLSAVACEESTVLLVSCRHILHTCQNNCAFHQRLIYNMMKNLAAQTVLSFQRIEITAKRTTRQKLLAYLTLQAGKAGSRDFTIPFDRQELADYLEVDRSGLSAEIGKLQREGRLKSRRNHFTLL